MGRLIIPYYITQITNYAQYIGPSSVWYTPNGVVIYPTYRKHHTENGVIFCPTYYWYHFSRGAPSQTSLLDIYTYKVIEYYFPIYPLSTYNFPYQASAKLRIFANNTNYASARLRIYTANSIQAKAENTDRKQNTSQAKNTDHRTRTSKAIHYDPEGIPSPTSPTTYHCRQLQLRIRFA